MVKHLIHEHDVSMNETGFDGLSVEVLKETAVVHRWTTSLRFRPQPHEKAVLQPFQPCKVGNCGSTPYDATVLDDRSDVCIKCAQYGSMLETRSTRTMWHLHAPHEESEHPVSFGHD